MDQAANRSTEGESAQAGALPSFIVSHFGLDGQREHWMPGNRRRGTGPREKRGFADENEALAFIASRGLRTGSRAYRCSICGDWHLASPGRA